MVTIGGNDRNYEYIDEFVDDILDLLWAADRDELSIEIIAQYDRAKEIIELLAIAGGISLNTLRIAPYEESGYGDEYSILLCADDDVIQLTAEPLRDAHGYNPTVGDDVFLLDDINSRILSVCDTPSLHFVHIGEDDFVYSNGCDDLIDENLSSGASRNVTRLKTSDNTVHGFTATKRLDGGYSSYSYVGTAKLSDADIDEMLDLIGF